MDLDFELTTRKMRYFDGLAFYPFGNENSGDQSNEFESLNSVG